MPDSVRIFAYGSLLYRPELPKRIEARIEARLPGYRRRFNKRSTSRYCRLADSLGRLGGVPTGFDDGERYRSLVLGTIEDASAAMPGLLLCYPAAIGEELLERMDRREGYDAARPSRLNGYLRLEREAIRRGTGERASCWVYLSNADPECVYSLPAGMTDEQCARVLVNATPRRREDAPVDDPGYYYLEGVRERLREHGLVDDDLEQLAAMVRELAPEAVVEPPAIRRR